MSLIQSNILNLLFPLNVEDEWPPFAVESLTFEKVAEHFRLLSCPLFVKGLSVNDVIEAKIDDNHHVSNWQHFSKSKNTTIWLLRQKLDNRIPQHLKELQAIGCSIVDLGKYGCFAVDVPENVHLSTVDQVIECCDPDEVAVAFPSLRHDDYI